MQTTGKVYYVPEIESLFFEGMDLFAKVIEIDENLYLCNASSHEGLGTVFMIDWEENRIYDYKLDEVYIGWKHTFETISEVKSNFVY